MQTCTKCLLPESYPKISFDSNGVCSMCRVSEEDYETGNFENEKALIDELEKIKSKRKKYDVLVLLSGGVDSSSALIKLVKEYKLNVLAWHLDNGFLEKQQGENVKGLCKALNVDLIVSKADIEFMYKLYKYINESDKMVGGCAACIDIIYLEALQVAIDNDIPLVVSGFTKGQIIEMKDRNRSIQRLRTELNIIKETGDDEFYKKLVSKYNVLNKRTLFLKKEDLINYLENDSDKILFIPFYIFSFNKTDKEELRKKVQEVCDWRPIPKSYPNKSSNCKMVWLNTYVELVKYGYSAYTSEYAELIRKGEITKEQAQLELEFNPPEGLLTELAETINCDLKKIKSIIEK